MIMFQIGDKVKSIGSGWTNGMIGEVKEIAKIDLRISQPQPTILVRFEGDSGPGIFMHEYDLQKLGAKIDLDGVLVQ